MTAPSPLGHKLSTLLSALEHGLTDERFLFERRDLAALVALAVRQGEILEVVCRLARELGVRPGSDFACRIGAFAAARREMLGRMSPELAAMEAELASMRRASTRLRQIRSASSTAETGTQLCVQG
jgi:hypothetical protein